MTLREFIDQLTVIEETYGDELTVVLSKDGEGNEFRGVAQDGIGEGDYDGEDFVDLAYLESGERPNAVCIWPIY